MNHRSALAGRAPRDRGLHRVAALLLLGAGQPSALAADVPWEHAWYQVEVVVFERSASDTTDELLEHDAPRRFPRDVLAFDDEESRARFYPLDERTLAERARPPGVDLALLERLGVDVRTAQARTATATSQLGTNPESTAPAELTAPTPVTPWQELVDATARFEATLVARNGRWLGPESQRLGNERRRLAARGDVRVLLHGAWVQAVPPRERPMPFLVQVGESVGGAYEVEGTIGVTVARYLHLGVELWQNLASADGAKPLYLVLREQRRMRSGEVHYLDHPRLGVLARIDPIEVPAELRALADAI